MVQNFRLSVPQGMTGVGPYNASERDVLIYEPRNACSMGTGINCSMKETFIAKWLQSNGGDGPIKAEAPAQVKGMDEEAGYGAVEEGGGSAHVPTTKGAALGMIWDDFLGPNGRLVRDIQSVYLDAGACGASLCCGHRAPGSIDTRIGNWSAAWTRWEADLNTALKPYHVMAKVQSRGWSSIVVTNNTDHIGNRAYNFTDVHNEMRYCRWISFAHTLAEIEVLSNEPHLNGLQGGYHQGVPMHVPDI